MNDSTTYIIMATIAMQKQLKFCKYIRFTFQAWSKHHDQSMKYCCLMLRGMHLKWMEPQCCILSHFHRVFITHVRPYSCFFLLSRLTQLCKGQTWGNYDVRVVSSKLPNLPIPDNTNWYYQAFFFNTRDDQNQSWWFNTGHVKITLTCQCVCISTNFL